MLLNRKQEFETTLKDAVRGKRLSQSKMTKTVDIAMSCMEVRPSPG